jgi:hypothetical protein
MARFVRLTRADLDTHTRSELLDRLEAEQQYWFRKERRGMSDADRAARAEFGTILATVLDPDGLAQSMREDAAWIRGERGRSTFWDDKPGQPKP